MNLSIPVHRLSVVAIAVIIAAVAILAPSTPARAEATIPQECLDGKITLHKDSDLKGEMGWISPGLEWPYMVSGWNDVVSSVCVPPGAYITLFQNSYFGGSWTTLDARGYSTPRVWASLSWWWNDATSSFKSGR